MEIFGQRDPGGDKVSGLIEIASPRVGVTVDLVGNVCTCGSVAVGSENTYKNYRAARSVDRRADRSHVTARYRQHLTIYTG